MRALLVEFARLLEYLEWRVGVAAEIGDCGGKVGTALAQWLAMSGTLPLEAGTVGLDGSLAHDGAAEDKCGALGFAVGTG